MGTSTISSVQLLAMVADMKRGLRKLGHNPRGGWSLRIGNANTQLVVLYRKTDDAPGRADHEYTAAL